MKLPKYLLASIIVFLLLGAVGLGLRIFSNIQILEDIANLCLIITLVIVSLYVYYTYMLAKDAWRSSASFTVKTHPNDSFIIVFSLQNYSKNSLECWCNINATVNGQTVALGGYYSGQHSWKLQPFGNGSGWFSIRDILTKVNCDVESMQEDANSENIKKQLYLKIDFWYSTIGMEEKIHNPIQLYYFDFNQKEIILDV